jgi:UDPglucose 6-dehydrogenase
MKIAILGAGYVGVVSGACFAEIGHDVVCVDVEREKIDRINKGETPIYEHGLEDLLRKHVGKRLTATMDLSASVRGAEVTFITVGTPFDGERIDLSYVRTVARQIGSALRDVPGYHVVVVKSTVVPGTTDDVVLPLLEEVSGKRAGAQFGVGMNPEFLTEGTAVSDFMRPDRIVLGGMDERTIDVLERLYEPFAADVPRFRTSNKTAEMIKYASNAVLATLMSFSNELGNLCARLGDVDVADVMCGVHLARYFTTPIGGGERVTAPITSFLYAGCGFGGSCLPKDVKALVAHGETAGQAMPLLDAVIKINLEQPKRIIEILTDHFATLEGLKVTVLGLAFKPDTDDMRESPAIPIIRELVKRGAAVVAFDPVANEAARKVLCSEPIRFADNLEQALQNAEAIVLVTSWEAFRSVPDLLAHAGKSPLVVDGRRMLYKKRVARYAGIGLRDSRPSLERSR